MKNTLFLMGLCFVSASCDKTPEMQRQKKYLDTLLSGEPVSITELERKSNEDEPRDYYSRILPHETAQSLGYSDEDVETLKKVKIVLELSEKEK